MIAGGGRSAYFLARSFLSKRHQVTLLNRDEAECRWLARRLKALVVHTDASAPGNLKEAGVESTDAVLAITPEDEVNLCICQSSRHLFGVEKTLALVNDPELVDVFHELGVSNAFSLTHVLTSTIERRVEADNILNLLPLGNGEVTLTEIVLDENSPVVGLSLAEIELPEASLIACIFRNEKPLIPRGGTRVEMGDRLVVLTLAETYAEVLRKLTGERG